MRVPHLRAWRQRVVLTQAQLAERADVTEATVNRIEQGKDARIPTIQKLALALGIPPGALLREPRENEAAAA